MVSKNIDFDYVAINDACEVKPKKNISKPKPKVITFTRSKK